MKNKKFMLFVVIGLLFLSNVYAAVVSHTAEEIKPGTFQKGTYVYPAPTSKVGIGISPTSELDVNGQLKIESGIADKIVFDGSQSDPNTISEINSKGFRFWDDTAQKELARITKVGIGIGGNPDFPLDIVGAKDGYAVRLKDGGLFIYADGSMTYSGTSIVRNWGDSRIGIYDTTATRTLTIGDNFGSAQKVNVIINPYGGSVGIGTTPSANAKLEIAGQIKITGGNPGANKVLTSDANGLATWQPISLSLVGSFGQTLRNDGTSFVADSLLFNDGSKIGIGTTTPSPNAKLEIAGQIKIVDGTQAAGKVLTSDASGLASWQTPIGGVVGWTEDVAGNKIYTTNTGRTVGIGTKTPSQQLHVFSSLDNVALFESKGTSSYINLKNSNGIGEISSSGNDFFIGGKDPGNIFFRNNGYNVRMSIDPSGNVGIGTTTPEQKLDVNGKGSFYETNANGFGLVAVSGPGDGTQFSAVDLSSNSGNTWGIQYRQDTGNLAFGYFPTGKYPLELTQSGNIGIGTTNPNAKLHLVDRASALNDYGLLISGPNNLNKFSVADINFVNENSGAWWHQTLRPTNQNGNLEWHGRTSFNPAESPIIPLSLTLSGRVGIGTTNPSEKLDIVGGNIRSDTGFCIGSSCITSWAASGVSGVWTEDAAGNKIYTTSTGRNVGIGTTNPANYLGLPGALDVNGQVRAVRFYDEDPDYFIDINSGANVGGTWNFNGNLRANGGLKIQAVCNDPVNPEIGQIWLNTC